MQQFNKGDRVRYTAEPHGVLVEGSTGTVTEDSNAYVCVQWDAGTEAIGGYPLEDDRIETHSMEFIELEHDQATVNAILAYLRSEDYYNSANAVERHFAVPQTRTVSVDFQVPDGKSVVDYLKDVGIDYDIKED